MKKLVAILLVFVLALSAFVSCSPVEEPEDNVKITVGVLAGPTGMGLAKLMNDSTDSEKYEFKLYSSPNDATPDLANGTLDMLCLPTNTAAMLSAKQDISIVAINCLGSLYLMTDGSLKISSIEELNGKTIYASVPNSTTGPIIEFLLQSKNVDAEVVFEPDHDALVAKVVKGEAPIVVLPEPKASAALAKNSNYAIDLNLSTEWSKVSETPLTMGCIVARNDFIDEHPVAVKRFLKDCESSIDFIGNKDNTATAVEMIVGAGIIPAAPMATKALNNLYGSIIYMDGAEMKNALIDFYSAIELPLPDEKVYYAK